MSLEETWLSNKIILNEVTVRIQKSSKVISSIKVQNTYTRGQEAVVSTFVLFLCTKKYIKYKIGKWFGMIKYKDIFELG